MITNFVDQREKNVVIQFQEKKEARHVFIILILLCVFVCLFMDVFWLLLLFRLHFKMEKKI